MSNRPTKFELIDIEINELQILVNLLCNSSDGQVFEIDHNDVIDLLNMILKKFKNTQSNILEVYRGGN